MNKHVIYTGGPGTGKTRALDEIAGAYEGQADIIRLDLNTTGVAGILSLPKRYRPASERATFVFIDDLRAVDGDKLEAVKTLIATAPDRVRIHVSAEAWPADFGDVESVKFNPDRTVSSTAYQLVGSGPDGVGNSVVVRRLTRAKSRRQFATSLAA